MSVKIKKVIDDEKRDSIEIELKLSYRHYSIHQDESVHVICVGVSWFLDFL